MTSDEKSKKEQHDLTVDMLLRKKLYIPGLQILASSALAILFLLAIVLRVSLYRVVSSDYTFFLSQWYDFMQTHGGFAALKYNFSNYNPPYLYLLALTTYLPIPKLVAIKTLSVVFDGVLGLAISFKLQAIFFLPVLLIVLLRRKWAMKYLLLIPAVFLLMLAPAFLAGRDAWSLLTIYVGQITSAGVGGPGQFNGGAPGQFYDVRPGQSNGIGRGPFNGGGPGGGGFSSSSFTFNAPSFYQWLPAGAPEYWKWIGIILAVMFVVLIGVLIMASKKQLTPAIILKVALVFALAIPFFLPEMHERYFYLADVLSIIYAFYFPRYFFVAIIMQLCSLLSYAPYFLQTSIVNLAYVAFAVLVITVITTADLILTLYPNIRKKAAIQASS